MFIGHAILAFAVLTGFALAGGVERRRALLVGVIAGLFATVPDVDMVYALIGLADGRGIMDAAASFWAASTVVHRGATHSLVIGGCAAVLFAMVERYRYGAVCGLVVLVFIVGSVSGGLAGVVTMIFVAAGLAITVVAARCGLDAWEIGIAAGIGLLSHPFGDIFTGVPPKFLYPFEVSLVGGRVAPFGDATWNLLLAFGVELSVIWLGIVVLGRVVNRSVREGIRPRASVGAVYGVAALLLAPPTMTVSYPFVFSVLAVGVIGVPATRRELHAPCVWTVTVTGLAAVTVGVIAYATVYTVIG